MSVITEPKFAIGQRAFLIRVGPTSENPKACVVWDCITYLDQQTVDQVSQLEFGSSFVYICKSIYVLLNQC